MASINTATIRRLALGLTIVAAVSAVASAKTPFDDLDGNGDGKLSRAEFTGGEGAFRAADKDKDGFLSKEEYDGIPEIKKEDEDAPKIAEVRTAFLKFGAALRSHKMKYDVYPVALEELVSKGHLGSISKDPWGRDYIYSLEAPKPPKGAGAEGDGDSDTDEKPSEVRAKGESVGGEDAAAKGALEFKIRCLGADGKEGTLDDIVRTKRGVTLWLARSAREALVIEAGLDHKKALAALSWEQAFRAWQAVAEYEYGTGKTATDLAEVEMPPVIFERGIPVDALGRQLRLRDVRGLRAIHAEEIPDEAPRLTLTEAEFVHHLQRRMAANHNQSWRYNQLANHVRNFRDSHGRLPITLTELSGFASDRWFTRGRFGNTLVYSTINEDRSFIVIDMGVDSMPGGRGNDADEVFYGPEDVMEAATDGDGDWNFYGQEAVRFKKLNEAIDQAIERGKMVDKIKESFQGEGGEIPAGMTKEQWDKLPEAVKERFRAIHRRKQEAEAKKDGEKEGDAKEAEKKADAEKKDDADKEAAKPEDPKPDAPKPEDPKPAESEPSAIGTHGGTPSIYHAAIATVLAQDAPAEPKDPPAPPAPAPAPPAPYALKSKSDLVPNLIYSETEARQVGNIVMDDWRWNNLRWLTQNFANICSNHAHRGASADFKAPIGNIALAGNEPFRKAVGDEWRNQGWWDESTPVPEWIIARFDLTPEKQLKAVVVLALPPKNSGLPIMISSMIDGNREGPYYASIKDQPEGWYEAVMKCDSDPAASVAADAPTESADAVPAENPAPPSEQPVNPSDAAKPE